MATQFVVRNSVIVHVRGAFAAETQDESKVAFALACRRLPKVVVGLREKRMRGILLDIVEAWDGVELPDGGPAPFDRSALKHLLRYRGLPDLAYAGYVERAGSSWGNLIECARQLVAGLDGDDAEIAGAVERRAQGIVCNYRYGDRPDLGSAVFIWPEHEHAVRVFASLVASSVREAGRSEKGPTAMVNLLVRSVPASYSQTLLRQLQVMSAAISTDGADLSENKSE